MKNKLIDKTDISKSLVFGSKGSKGVPIVIDSDTKYCRGITPETKLNVESMEEQKMDNIQSGSKITVVSTNAIGVTTKTEIMVIKFDGKYITYKPKGRAMLYKIDISESIVFGGFNVPVTVDSDTDYFRGNGRINILGTPEEIVQLIKARNMNPTANLSNISAIGNLGGSGEDQTETEVIF